MTKSIQPLCAVLCMGVETLFLASISQEGHEPDGSNPLPLRLHLHSPTALRGHYHPVSLPSLATCIDANMHILCAPTCIV